MNKTDKFLNNKYKKTDSRFDRIKTKDDIEISEKQYYRQKL